MNEPDTCNKYKQIGSSTKHTNTQNTDIRGRPMARARDTGTGARNHGTNKIHIYKGNCLGKAHANVLIIVVPFGSNFTG